MGKYTIKVNGIEEYPIAAREFVQQMNGGRIFAFYGKMGAGKTTLIKSICEEMGVEDTINSPTFAIVNEYEDREMNTIYHFDYPKSQLIAQTYPKRVFHQ